VRAAGWANPLDDCLGKVIAEYMEIGTTVVILVLMAKESESSSSHRLSRCSRLFLVAGMALGLDAVVRKREVRGREVCR